MKNLLVIFILFLFCTACEQKHFYNEYKAVNVNAWKSTDTLTYDVDIKDVKAVYDIVISVRYQNNYEFSNLWLSILNSSDNTNEPLRFEMPLFKKDGKPYGEKSGSLYTQAIHFKKQFTFSKAGKNTLKIVQLMRKDPLDGISDVGVIIDKKQ